MNRVEMLNRIFDIYENEISEETFFCHKGCSSCCTSNVIITSLELENLLKSEIDIDKFKNSSDIKRFQPLTTTNMIADLIKNGDIPPEEEIDSSWGKCAFLENGACTVYENRPFGCRCMVSKIDCSKSGCAEVDPYIITLNNVILQFIEHLDHDGVTGNILDMILEDDVNSDFRTSFIRNSKMKILMVPNEHRGRISKVTMELSKLFQPL